MGCRDIAYQLAHFSSGDGIEVMFGGGRREFYGSDFGGIRLSPEDDLVSIWAEGARIDHGHHAGIAGYALLETQEFARAVAIALEAVDLSETLVLVTAGHSHTLTMGGYTTRGNPILGLVVGNDVTGRPDAEPYLADDGLPYSVLSYANGPGGLTELPRTNIDTVQQALVPLSAIEIDGAIEPEESHGGEDVALYANGPWSHLMGGVLEQNAIFHIINYAFGWDRNNQN